MVLPRQRGKSKGMQRVKHPPVRNKINLKDPVQVRVWTRRLGVGADALKAAVDKVGNSIAAVTKEVEMQQREAGRPARLQAAPASARASFRRIEYIAALAAIAAMQPYPPETRACGVPQRQRQPAELRSIALLATLVVVLLSPPVKNAIQNALDRAFSGTV